jgi:adenylate cyclase
MTGPDPTLGRGDVREPPAKLTRWQKHALKKLVKHARKTPGHPLEPADWSSYFTFAAQPSNRMVKRVLRSLPSTPRCGYCGAPFAGMGGHLVRPLGYRPSRKNPNICATCVELSPPGGATTEAGVLFADLRGFTALSEREGGHHASGVLRDFYSMAERVFFPEALIDKLIGDEVMALYLPVYLHQGAAGAATDADRRRVTGLMLEHARELLQRIGYGTPSGPRFEVGLGLDYGEVFIGNIGDGAVQDFTAVGDVVNTAARLQGKAAGGETLVTERLARYLETPVGEPEHLLLKGKDKPIAARRIRL